MGPVRTFLKAVERLARNGDISIDDAYRFAKQQFGEVSDLMKLQINRLFKQKPASGIKKQKEGEVVPFTRKQDTPDQAPGLEGLKNPFRTGGGLDPLEGMTRAAARAVLNRRGIEVPDRGDAIDIFEENFGGDALMDLKNVADELLETSTTGNVTKNLDKVLEDQGMFDLKVDKTARKGMSNKELLEKMEEAEQEDILKKFDPEDREPNAMGGINRASFAKGKIKLIQFLAGKGKDLAKEIKKSVDDIFTTDDIKYDADVAVDNMLDDLGIDRDTVDQKDLLDAYGMAYDELKKPLLSTIKNKPGSFKGVDIKDPKFDEDMPFDNDAEKLAEIKMSNENFDLEKGLNDLDEFNVTKDAAQAKKILDDVDEAYGLTPKMKEELALKEKYPGIDEELVAKIVDDPDPQRKAEVLATIEQAFELMKQGKSSDEVLDIMKQMTDRTKQAEGGLSYLMGM